jgi:16S rRNA (uracil1498-N3)-methyltransferase
MPSPVADAVTAPLFLVEPGALDGAAVGAEVRLDGPEARHAVQVRRIAVGERIDLADGAGGRVEGVVRRLDAAGGRGGGVTLVLEVTARADEPEPATRLVLVQALAKGDRDLAAVESATELGVDEIVPWQAERSIVVWRGERAEKSQNRWGATARAAAKQSRRARVPLLADVVDSAGLTDRVARAALALVLHEAADRPIAGVGLPDSGDVLVVVGPEGGIGAAELDRLVAAGAIAVRLGDTVLRSSSAGPAALAVLLAAGRWR